jgi:long-chain fatty acid transport protein
MTSLTCKHEKCFRRFAMKSYLALALLWLPSAAFGLGIRIADQDPFATARGNAFTATADNPSAIYYNPAGITQLDGNNFRIGAYGISFETDYITPDGTAFDTKEELQIAPQFYYSFKPESQPLALGLGIYSPFGFSIEYPDNVPFRTLARDGAIRFLTINPVFAFQITESLSIAVGATINYAEAEFGRGILAPGDRFSFEGSGVGYGFNAGLLWKPHRMHSFGVNYRSPVKIHFTGHSSANFTNEQISQFEAANAQITAANAAIRAIQTQFAPFGPDVVNAVLASFGLPSEQIPLVQTSFPEEDADAEFQFPQNIVFGYSFRPNDSWNFEFNIDWTDWDNLNTVTLNQQLSGPIALPFNWESSFFYEFGVTHYMCHGLHASLGYIYSENSVPEVSFNPVVPDSDRHIFSVGFGQKLEHLSWDIAYQLAYGPSREIENNTLANGKYEFLSHAITVAFGYNF